MYHIKLESSVNLMFANLPYPTLRVITFGEREGKRILEKREPRQMSTLRNKETIIELIVVNETAKDKKADLVESLYKTNRLLKSNRIQKRVLEYCDS